MSFINRFSIRYNLGRANSKNESSKRHAQTIVRSKRGMLSDKVARTLIEFGYDIQSLMLLLKLHPYSTVEEALNFLEKDPDTGKYGHEFYHPQSNQNFQLISKCDICQGTLKDHLNISKLVSENNNINQKNIPCYLTSSNNDISHTPLINDQNKLIQDNDKEGCDNIVLSKFVKKKRKFSYGKIQIDKETLVLFDSPDICRICFANKVNQYNPAQVTCGHFFCDKCIKTYITTKILNGKVINIKCLMGGCPKQYNDNEIKSNISEDIYLKYKKFRNKQIKLQNREKKFIQCPFPDCEELINIDEIETFLVSCANNHTFCIRCRQIGKHKKNKCLQEDIVLLQQIKKGNRKKFINYKQCPKCKVIIEKNEKCNQMHCENCGYNFCWLCLKKYTDDHYAIYNVTGCPGMRFENDSGSRWIRNRCLKILWYFFSGTIWIIALFGVLLFYFIFGCAYEFIHCYRNPKKEENHLDSDDDINEDEFRLEDDNHAENKKYNAYMVKEEIRKSNDDSKGNIKEQNKRNNFCIMGILVICGCICQPFYIFFYILYGVMECYKRFNCWFYYMDT